MFTIDRIVPWGRSFDEYVRMFALTASDLDGRLLGCGDGPASFNAEATRRGHVVVSCDPIYRFGRARIEERIAATCGQVLDQTRRNAHEFVWSGGIRNVEDLGRLRMTAMQAFLDDFESGRQQGRYVDASLPALPFESRAFDLALCSHVLFLYSQHLDLAFHLAALHEMCRVAAEVRVFPLLALGGRPSPFVDACTTGLSRSGFQVRIERVPYEFRRGGNEMMRASRPERGDA